MSLRRHNPARDAIEPECCAALGILGISFLRISEKGAPDLLVWHRGIYWLIELKSAKGKLTPDQVRFHRDWRGPIHIVCSLRELIELINSSEIVSRGCR